MGHFCPEEHLHSARLKYCKRFRAPGSNYIIRLRFRPAIHHVLGHEESPDFLLLNETLFLDNVETYLRSRFA